MPASDPLFRDFEAHLQKLHVEHRRRSLSSAGGHDFVSNDYLGLANGPDLKRAVLDAVARGVPIGSGGSRLLRGNHPEHELLEEEAARFFGSESALFFSSGYAANSAVLSTLPQRGDLIIYDELIHASSHEGIRLARAKARSARHNQADSFAAIVKQWRSAGGTGRPWIIVESLYSMEGDKAPLRDLLELSNEHDGFLVIDEAHATGVFGRNGRGLSNELGSHPNVITVRTCGKALGCEGALVCCPSVIRDFLVNRGRGFIFSTAPSPLMAAAVRAVLKLLAKDERRQVELRERIAFAEDCLRSLGVRCSGTQILPLVLGSAARVMRLADRLQEQGFDVRGIRPPTVPQGTSRVRISITLNADEKTIERLSQAILEAMA